MCLLILMYETADFQELLPSHSVRSRLPLPVYAKANPSVKTSMLDKLHSLRAHIFSFLFIPFLAGPSVSAECPLFPRYNK